jgi:hypothetical protein
MSGLSLPATPRHIAQAGARMCKCLGDEMVPYLPIVMPPLLASAQLKPELEVRGEDEVAEDEADDDDPDVEKFWVAGKVCVRPLTGPL